MTNFLAFLCLAAGAGYFLLQVLLHRADTGYSPIRNAVSDYGVGSTAGMFRLSAAANTIVLLALGSALISDGGGWTDKPLVLLAIAVVARLLVAVFPTDVPGAPRTRAGRIHLLAAVVQFAAVYSFVVDEAGTLTAGTWMQGFAEILSVAALVGLVGVVAGLLPLARRWFGAFERLFLWTSTAALLCCAGALIS